MAACVDITYKHFGIYMYWQRRNALSYHETLTVIKHATSSLNLSSRYMPQLLTSALLHCRQEQRLVSKRLNYSGNLEISVETFWRPPMAIKVCLCIV